MPSAKQRRSPIFNQFILLKPIGILGGLWTLWAVSIPNSIASQLQENDTNLSSLRPSLSVLPGGQPLVVPPVNLETVAAVFGSTRLRRKRPAPLTGCVNVLPDTTTRLGALSYNVPQDLVVHVGDAVKIPFGKKQVHGMVIGPGDSEKATKDVLEVFGVRSDPSDISLAHAVAKYHFVDPNTVLARLSPTTGRGAEPADAGPVVTSQEVQTLRVPKEVTASKRTLLVRAPHVNPAVLAAQQAAELSQNGQVLVLCPTAKLVAAVLEHLPSGAVRLDSKAPRGAWKGFCEGSATIGVGTRTAALYAADSLAGIVVVDEEHPGHLEVRQPATNARDLASARSRALRVPLRMIALTPTPQAFGAAVDVYAVGLRSHWPKMFFLDRASLDPTQRLLPDKVKTAVTAAKRSHKKPVVLAATSQAMRRCVKCAVQRPCTECDSSLCRHPETTPCPQCGTTEGVRMRGWDKERLVELFQSHAKVVSLSELSEVKDAGVVVIFDLDGVLNAAELIPGRLAASVIATAAQAAGSGGSVYALGEQPKHPLVKDLFGAKDMIAVSRRAYAAAKAANLPPLGRLVTIKVERARAPQTNMWPGQVYGPKKTSGAEWEILVRIPNEDLSDLAPYILKLRKGGKCKVRVE